MGCGNSFDGDVLQRPLADILADSEFVDKWLSWPCCVFQRSLVTSSTLRYSFCRPSGGLGIVGAAKTHQSRIP